MFRNKKDVAAFVAVAPVNTDMIDNAQSITVSIFSFAFNTSCVKIISDLNRIAFHFERYHFLPISDLVVVLA